MSDSKKGNVVVEKEPEGVHDAREQPEVTAAKQSGAPVKSAPVYISTSGKVPTLAELNARTQVVTAATEAKRDAAFEAAKRAVAEAFGKKA